MEFTKQGPKRRRRTRRDVQRGRGGMTSHWLRMDWFNPYRGDDSEHHPTGNKVRRQLPADSNYKDV